MQNKPNSPNAQINVSVVITKYYENIPLSRSAENKAKQTQFKANSNPIKPNFKPPAPKTNPIKPNFFYFFSYPFYPLTPIKPASQSDLANPAIV